MLLDKILPILAMVLVIAMKAVLLVLYAPFEPAQNMFVWQASETILAGFGWLSDADELANPYPLTLWRPVSYAIITALAKLLAGDYWVWLVLALQSLLGVIAALYVYRLGRALGLGIGISTLAIMLYAFSVSLSNDVLLLADGLVGSIGTICLCLLGISLIGKGPTSSRSIIYSGLLMMGCFLLRDSMLYPALILAMIIGIYTWISTKRWVQGAMNAAIFITPVILMFVIIGSWNSYRTGHWVITTGGQHAYLYSVLKTAQIEPRVFQTGSLLDQSVLSEKIVDYDDEETIRVNYDLGINHRMSAIDIHKLMKEKFYWVLRTYPEAFVKAYFSRLNPKRQEPIMGNPFRNIDQLDSWTTESSGKDYWTDTRKNIQSFYETRDLSHIDAKTALSFYPRIGFRLLNLGLLGVFLLALPIGTLIVLAKSAEPDQRRRWGVIALLWAFYIAVLLIYALIDVKPRYLSPVVVSAILGSLFTLNEALRAPFIADRTRRWTIIGRG